MTSSFGLWDQKLFCWLSIDVGYLVSCASSSATSKRRNSNQSGSSLKALVRVPHKDAAALEWDVLHNWRSVCYETGPLRLARVAPELVLCGGLVSALTVYGVDPFHHNDLRTSPITKAEPITEYCTLRPTDILTNTMRTLSQCGSNIYQTQIYITN